jgi:hypothetical protein
MVFDPCDPTDQDNAALTSCGIFVRNEGNDSNPGTADLPVATLVKAVELAAGKGHVYACQQTFVENLVLTQGVSLHGGLDCIAGWAYTGPLAPPTVLAPVAGVPLVLKNGPDRAHLRSFHLLAPPGTAPGESSIAVIAAGSTAVITDTRLEAGDASSGVDGVDASQTPNPAAPDGLAGGNACSAASVPGGSAKDNTCNTSTGGKGGDGGLVSGGAGLAGMPSPGGAAGAGESGAGWACAPSGLGKDGSPGGDGLNGAAGLSLGQITENGYQGANGSDGDPGQPGSGGGGGGGRAGAQCSGKAGAAGGGGAPGGCGGKGGGGGMAGGSSIGLLSVGASITLKNTVITTGNGGLGGRGFAGQPGAIGGKGGVGGMGMGAAPAGCAGGAGGAGGHGGIGGGGRGGHSIGVAHDGAFSLPKGNSIVVGSAGPGGTSTNGNVTGNAGAEGTSADTVKF